MLNYHTQFSSFLKDKKIIVKIQNIENLLQKDRFSTLYDYVLTSQRVEHQGPGTHHSSIDVFCPTDCKKLG